MSSSNLSEFKPKFKFFAIIVGFIFTNSSGTGSYYYDKNPRGDVIAILDNSGNTVVQYKYDAYMVKLYRPLLIKE